MSSERPRILCVDDDPTTRGMYHSLLSRKFEVTIAITGEEALEMAQSSPPDLVLLDVELPGMRGTEVCRRLREHTGLRLTKILLVSSHKTPPDRLLGYEAGADDYVGKPFEADELLAKIRVFLRLKAAEEVERLKTDALGLLCHESRTPLNGILAPAQALLETPLTEDQRMLVSIIAECAADLHGFLEKVLLLSQFRAGTVETITTRIELEQGLETLVETASEKASKKKVTLKLRTDQPVVVAGNQDLLRLTVGAVLDNAVNYAPDGSSVEIAIRVKASVAQVVIEDTGTGIPLQLLPRLFDALSIEDLRHHQRGSSISLSLARAIARHLGGDIEAHSTETEPTRFTVRFPVVHEETVAG